MEILVIDDCHEALQSYSNRILKFFHCNIDLKTDIESFKKGLHKKKYNLIFIKNKILENNDFLIHELQLIRSSYHFSIIIITDEDDLGSSQKYNKLKHCYYIKKSEIDSKIFVPLIWEAALHALFNNNKKSSLNILVIEDDVGDFQLYKRYLNSMFKCNLQHCLLQEKALELLKTKQYDLIILDYNLPAMNGVEFLHNLKANNNDLSYPIVVITGQKNTNIATEFMKLGAGDYISKDDLSLSSISKSIYSALEIFSNNQIYKETQSELLLFAHTVAHDIKSPLGRINSYAKLLKSNKGNNVDKYIENIVEDSKYAIDFVDNLLRFAELGRSTFKKEAVDLNEAVAQSIKNLELEITKRKAKVKFSKLPVIYGDKICLVELFQNLISNSIKYCVCTPKISISAVNKNKFFIISVVDNGIGIIKKMTKKIFKPFTRINNGIDVTGTGLGLALCDLIAKQHGAKINIYPHKTGGTMFSIIFPIETTQREVQ